MTYVHNQHANVDNRRLYRFDAVHYVEVKDPLTGQFKPDREQRHLGWSMELYGDTKSETIKRFVSLTSPTTRFIVTDLTERQEVTYDA